MLHSLNAAIVFSGALLLGTILGASPSVAVARAHAGAAPGLSGAVAKSMMEQPIDPKKKKEGEACKNSDECQKHSTCTKVDGKDVCKAPPRPELPPGAVT